MAEPKFDIILKSKLTTADKELHQKYQNKESIDVALLCDNDQDVFAHQRVLTQASPYFGKIFKRSSLCLDAVPKLVILSLPDVDKRHLSSLMDLAYLGETVFPPSDLKPVLETGHKLNFKEWASQEDDPDTIEVGHHFFRGLVGCKKRTDDYNVAAPTNSAVSTQTLDDSNLNGYESAQQHNASYTSDQEDMQTDHNSNSSNYKSMKKSDKVIKNINDLIPPQNETRVMNHQEKSLMINDTSFQFDETICTCQLASREDNISPKLPGVDARPTMSPELPGKDTEMPSADDETNRSYDTSSGVGDEMSDIADILEEEEVGLHNSSPQLDSQHESSTPAVVSPAAVKSPKMPALVTKNDLDKSTFNVPKLDAQHMKICLDEKSFESYKKKKQQIEVETQENAPEPGGVRHFVAKSVNEIPSRPPFVNKKICDVEHNYDNNNVEFPLPDDTQAVDDGGTKDITNKNIPRESAQMKMKTRRSVRTVKRNVNDDYETVSPPSKKRKVKENVKRVAQKKSAGTTDKVEIQNRRTANEIFTLTESKLRSLIMKMPTPQPGNDSETLETPLTPVGSLDTSFEEMPVTPNTSNAINATPTNRTAFRAFLQSPRSLIRPVVMSPKEKRAYEARGLNYRERMMARGKEFPLKCKYCPLGFATEHTLATHVAKYHPSI